MTYDQLSPVQCVAGLLLLAVGAALMVPSLGRYYGSADEIFQRKHGFEGSKLITPFYVKE